MARNKATPPSPISCLSPPHLTQPAARAQLSSAQKTKPREPPLLPRTGRRAALLAYLAPPRAASARPRGRARCPSSAPGRSRPPRACCGLRSRTASFPWPCTRRPTRRGQHSLPSLLMTVSWGAVGGARSKSQRGGDTTCPASSVNRDTHPMRKPPKRGDDVP